MLYSMLLSKVNPILVRAKMAKALYQAKGLS